MTKPDVREDGVCKIWNLGPEEDGKHRKIVVSLTADGSGRVHVGTSAKNRNDGFTIGAGIRLWPRDAVEVAEHIIKLAEGDQG